MPDETRGTVVLALAANVGVAVIKLAAGLLTGPPGGVVGGGALGRGYHERSFPAGVAAQVRAAR